MEQNVMTEELTAFDQIRGLLPRLTDKQLSWLRLVGIPEQLKERRGIPKPPVGTIGTKALPAQIPVL